MYGLDTTKCYKLKKDGSYLGQFVRTEDNYPDGPWRGGSTLHYFLKDGKEYFIHGPYNDLTPYEVTECQETSIGGRRRRRRMTKKSKRRSRKTRRRV